MWIDFKCTFFYLMIFYMYLLIRTQIWRHNWFISLITLNCKTYMKYTCAHLYIHTCIVYWPVRFFSRLAFASGPYVINVPISAIRMISSRNSISTCCFSVTEVYIVCKKKCIWIVKTITLATIKLLIYKSFHLLRNLS